MQRQKLDESLGPTAPAGLFSRQTDGIVPGQFDQPDQELLGIRPPPFQRKLSTIFSVASLAPELHAPHDELIAPGDEAAHLHGHLGEADKASEEKRALQQRHGLEMIPEHELGQGAPTNNECHYEEYEDHSGNIAFTVDTRASLYTQARSSVYTQQGVDSEQAQPSDMQITDEAPRAYSPASYTDTYRVGEGPALQLDSETRSGRDRLANGTDLDSYSDFYSDQSMNHDSVTAVDKFLSHLHADSSYNSELPLPETHSNASNIRTNRAIRGYENYDYHGHIDANDDYDDGTDNDREVSPNVAKVRRQVSSGQRPGLASAHRRYVGEEQGSPTATRRGALFFAPMPGTYDFHEQRRLLRGSGDRDRYGHESERDDNGNVMAGATFRSSQKARSQARLEYTDHSQYPMTQSPSQQASVYGQASGYYPVSDQYGPPSVATSPFYSPRATLLSESPPYYAANVPRPAPLRLPSSSSSNHSPAVALGPGPGRSASSASRNSNADISMLKRELSAQIALLPPRKSLHMKSVAPVQPTAVHETRAAPQSHTPKELDTVPGALRTEDEQPSRVIMMQLPPPPGPPPNMPLPPLPFVTMGDITPKAQQLSPGDRVSDAVTSRRGALQHSPLIPLTPPSRIPVHGKYNVVDNFKSATISSPPRARLWSRNIMRNHSNVETAEYMSIDPIVDAVRHGMASTTPSAAAGAHLRPQTQNQPLGDAVPLEVKRRSFSILQPISEAATASDGSIPSKLSSSIVRSPRSSMIEFSRTGANVARPYMVTPRDQRHGYSRAAPAYLYANHVHNTPDPVYGFPLDPGGRHPQHYSRSGQQYQSDDQMYHVERSRERRHFPELHQNEPYYQLYGREYDRHGDMRFDYVRPQAHISTQFVPQRQMMQRQHDPMAEIRDQMSARWYDLEPSDDNDRLTEIQRPPSAPSTANFVPPRPETVFTDVYQASVVPNDSISVRALALSPSNDVPEQHSRNASANVGTGDAAGNISPLTSIPGSGPKTKPAKGKGKGSEDGRGPPKTAPWRPFGNDEAGIDPGDIWTMAGKSSASSKRKDRARRRAGISPAVDSPRTTSTSDVQGQPSPYQVSPQTTTMGTRRSHETADRVREHGDRQGSYDKFDPLSKATSYNDRPKRNSGETLNRVFHRRLEARSARVDAERKRPQGGKSTEALKHDDEQQLQHFSQGDSIPRSVRDSVDDISPILGASDLRMHSLRRHKSDESVGI